MTIQMQSGNFTPSIATGVTASFGAANFVIDDITTLYDAKSTPVDTTSQASTANGSGIIYRTFLPSKIVDPGMVKFKIQCDVSAIPAVGSAGSLAITVPYGQSTKTLTFADSILESVSAGAALGAIFTGEVQFKLSGEPTVA